MMFHAYISKIIYILTVICFIYQRLLFLYKKNPIYEHNGESISVLFISSISIRKLNKELKESTQAYEKQTNNLKTENNDLRTKLSKEENTRNGLFAESVQTDSTFPLLLLYHVFRIRKEIKSCSRTIET